MILSAPEIRYYMAEDKILCDPKPKQLEGTHIDVTLGAHGWLFSPRGNDPLRIADIDPAEVFTPLQPFDGAMIIPARGFALLHTEEFIGTSRFSSILPLLHTRSTLARWGLSVHESAGLGDVGFASRWTLEVHNHHAVPVAIPVGARIGCVTFQSVKGMHNGDIDAYPLNTRYNMTRDTWTPQAMLPRRANW